MNDLGRQKLTDALGTLPQPLRDVLVTEIYDAIAHELAEKIRGAQHEHHDHIRCVPCFVYGEAADLIDPRLKEDNDQET
ncbi:hypothetical protein [Streptomyces sp. NPDC059009]|uniref:hypothetical protein n=1 Tax=Streptomyces sp. NPDC059009 TaxID=3346694 RepID=UPI003688EE4F